jgi:hypothetical protein
MSRRVFTVPRAGTLIGTLKAKVPSRDMGLTTNIHPCAQIVAEVFRSVLYGFGGSTGGCLEAEMSLRAMRHTSSNAKLMGGGWT